MGRLLAADVLLARLQREHEAAPAVGVGGLAGDPARHPPQVLLGGGEKAERGTAEVQAPAERLALADADVDPTRAGRAQDAERDRVDRGDAESAGAVGCVGERREVLDRAEEVRVRDEHRRGLIVDRRRELAGVGAAVSEPDLDHVGAEAARVGDQRLARMRMKAARDDQAPAPLAGAERQVGGRGDRRRTLVHRGVGDRERGQLGDRGLELEHRLQPALRDLGLIGRVWGEELRARDDRVDQRRHVVVVHAGADEAGFGVGVGVSARQRRQSVEDLRLALSPPADRAAGRAAARRGSRRTAPRPRRPRSPPASRRGRPRSQRCICSLA